MAVAAGGNTGDAAGTIRGAAAALARSGLLRAVRLSALYRTAPVRVSADAPDPGGDYINAAVVAESAGSPAEILSLLHAVERAFGRDRSRCPHGAPRPIDLDLLVVGDLTVQQPALTLPHPRMHQRAFVLAPLAELAPDLPVPGTGRTVAELLADLGPIDGAIVRRCD